MISDTSNEAPDMSQTEGNGATAEEAPSEQELLANKLQEAEKKYLYLYSEFESFRRRNEKERLDFLKFGHEGFLRDLLQVLDNFERALSHAKNLPADKGSPWEQFRFGIEMIHGQFTETLRSQGVQATSSEGAKFDPALHEAVAEEPAQAGQEAGLVLKVNQSGYTLHGRLLRAARVVVAGK
jgi:molecular chaperone GrpE